MQQTHHTSSARQTWCCLTWRPEGMAIADNGDRHRSSNSSHKGDTQEGIDCDGGCMPADLWYALDVSIVGRRGLIPRQTLAELARVIEAVKLHLPMWTSVRDKCNLDTRAAARYQMPSRRLLCKPEQPHLLQERNAVCRRLDDRQAAQIGHVLRRDQQQLDWHTFKPLKLQPAARSGLAEHDG